MGMIHEHQPSDASTYIDFSCENLEDYDDVKKEVEAKGEDKMEDVCKDGRLAFKYGTMAWDWTPELYGYGQILKAHLGVFDLQSIM
jgi:hypothetical protein